MIGTVRSTITYDKHDGHTVMVDAHCSAGEFSFKEAFGSLEFARDATSDVIREFCSKMKKFHPEVTECQALPLSPPGTGSEQKEHRL